MVHEARNAPKKKDSTLFMLTTLLLLTLNDLICVVLSDNKPSVQDIGVMAMMGHVT